MSKHAELQTNFLALLSALQRAPPEFKDTEIKEAIMKDLELKILMDLINHVQPILRFISYRLVKFGNYHFNGVTFKGHSDCFDQKGLLLCERVKDHPLPQSPSSKWEIKGYSYILFNDGSFKRYDRTGFYSQQQYYPHEFQLILSSDMYNHEIEFINEEGLITFASALLRDIDKSIRDNKKKQPILEKRKELNEKIKDLITEYFS